jgi:hypothetical protein
MKFWMLGMILGFLATAAGQTAEEYQVKAAFLLNFAKFVDWPPRTFKSATDPITICVVGKNPFGRTLDQAAVGQAIQGKPFSVRQLADLQQITACHIVFVASSERKRLAAIFHELKTSSALTVGETENFTAEGGIINFRIEDGNVRLQINPEAAAQQQIHISSKLLNLAEIVRK